MNETRNIIAGLEIGKDSLSSAILTEKSGAYLCLRKGRKQSVPLSYPAVQEAGKGDLALWPGGGLFLQAGGRDTAIRASGNLESGSGAGNRRRELHAGETDGNLSPGCISLLL